MTLRHLLPLLPALVLSTTLVALGNKPPAPADKGAWFVYWGYNRSMYSTSDIHFSGPGYDFTLRQVKATDRPSDLSLDTYLNPRYIWLPQYNYRVGYFHRERWSLSLGLDHLKYVVQQGQQVRMDGWVSPSRSEVFAMSEGSREVTLDEDFLTYEHTDGLNLLSFDLDHYNALWSSRDQRQRLHLFEGLHLGMLIPRSDVQLFGEGVNNVFHIAGVGAGAQLGLHFTFLQHLFLRTTGRITWVDLPSVLTTGTAEDRADQIFWAYQWNVALGGQFHLGRKKPSTRPVE